MNFFVAFLIFGIFFSLGCSKVETDSGTCLDGEAIIAQVNSQPILVDDVRKSYWYSACYFEVKSKMTPGGANALGRKIEKLKVDLLSRMVNSTLVLQEADHRGIAVSAENVEREVKKALKNFGGKEEFERLCASHGLDMDYVRRRVSEELRIQDVFKQVNASAEKVSLVEATNFVKRVEAYNNEVNATNKTVMTRAAKVLSQLSRDANFEEAAKKHAEFASEDGESWGEFNRGELPPDVEKWAFSASIGDLGGPFEVDDGIVIVKLLSRERGADQPSLAASSVASVSLARICFKAFEREQPFTIDEAYDFLSAGRARKTKEMFVKSLGEKAKVTFPLGKVPWKRILGEKRISGEN